MPERTTDPRSPHATATELHAPAKPVGSTAREATRATTAGTRRFAERIGDRGEDFHRLLPRRLTVSALGLGTYLGDCTDDDDHAYAHTMRAAIADGVNLIDTASNYRCQRSERAVGRAVEELIASGEGRRDELVICSKGGYVALDGEPPASREQYDAWLERNLFAPGVVARDELVRAGHSIAPSFLAHQLAQSRANLRLRTIDVYYVHNPEEQLLAVDRATFRERMRAAFTLLEERAESGDIVGYGCATWLGLRVGPEHRQHVTLAELVAIAREIAGATHHFRAVQLPVSLAMPEAARLATQPLGRKVVTLLEAADALGVGVVASAPLMQGRLTSGLPDEVRELFPECTTDAQRALRFASSLPGVATVLAGMRRTTHLRENIAAWRAPH
ncbi:MAG: NADP-dependent oxidoreductase domain protein [Gemmatimonadetes bacterium]|nr:NADP-dependent oxidoreductase domain protein [Gemmatimonadota bacterium]